MTQLFGRDPPVPKANFNSFALVERDLQLDVDAIDQSALSYAADGPILQYAGQLRRSLIIEGWRFLPHSYGIVNQWHLLELLRRPNIAVKVIDVPFYRAQWRAQEGLFDPRAEQILKSAKTADPNENADVTLRIFYPCLL